MAISINKIGHIQHINKNNNAANVGFKGSKHTINGNNSNGDVFEKSVSSENTIDTANTVSEQKKIDRESDSKLTKAETENLIGVQLSNELNTQAKETVDEANKKIKEAEELFKNNGIKDGKKVADIKGSKGTLVKMMEEYGDDGKTPIRRSYFFNNRLASMNDYSEDDKEDFIKIDYMGKEKLTFIAKGYKIDSENSTDKESDFSVTLVDDEIRCIVNKGKDLPSKNKRECDLIFHYDSKNNIPYIEQESEQDVYGLTDKCKRRLFFIDGKWTYKEPEKWSEVINMVSPFWL